MKLYTVQNWYEMAKDLYDLILSDIEKSFDDDLAVAYPKFVVMYEFFRLIRGEAFNCSRPQGIEEKLVKEIYDMENNLAERLKVLESKLDIKDDKTAYNLDQMKKSFSLKYFNKE